MIIGNELKQAMEEMKTPAADALPAAASPAMSLEEKKVKVPPPPKVPT